MKTNYRRVSIIKISSYVVTMKGINTGAITTDDTEAIFNRTLGIIGSEGFDLHDLFTHELAPIPTSVSLDDDSMISASSKSKLNNYLNLKSPLA